jgi:hypothetical protein
MANPPAGPHVPPAGQWTDAQAVALVRQLLPQAAGLPFNAAGMTRALQIVKEATS